MTDAADRERFYDEEIAPKLMELAKACEARGLGFVAVVEWQPGDCGHTATLPAGAGPAIRMAELAGRSRGNVDAFMIAVGKSDLARNGHNSIALMRMGFPNVPTPPPSPTAPEPAPAS